MSKKHFIALAGYIQGVNRACVMSNWPPVFSSEAISKLADFCEMQNQRFNRQRWLAYIAGECGPNGGKVKQAA